LEFLQKGYNLWLLMAAVVSGVLFIWPSIAKLLSKTKEVGVAQAVQLINRQDAAVIDVREPNEFRGGRIPNARNIPLGQLAGKVKDLEKLKDKPVLLSCQTGNRSAQAANTLRQAGFAQVYNLAGGMNAWQQASMPVEKEK
jgi:rhodanese-related sulfurtransferase